MTGVTDGAGWLELLIQDAPVSEFTALGARLDERGLARPGDTATALELKSLLQQRAQRAGALSALNDIAGRLSMLRSPEDLLPEIVDQARRLLHVDLAYLGLVEEAPYPAMRIAVTSGALTPGLVGFQVRLGASLAGQVIEQASPRWVSDYLSSATFPHDKTADTAALSENMRGLLGVPLGVRGRVIGALFACKRSERHFAEEEVALLSGLAAHAAIAIDNARGLARLAGARDELERTVAWNRRLTQLVLHGGGVEELLDEIASVTSAPVQFVRYDEPDDTRASAKDGRKLTTRAVMAGNRDFGALVMIGTDEPSREDVFILDQAAPVLALVLAAEEAVAEAGRYARDALLAELLTTASSDRARTNRLARRAGIDPTARYLVVVVDPVCGLAATREALRELSWPPGSGMTDCEGRSVVLVPADEPEAVQRLWASHDLPTAGVAGPAPLGPEIAVTHRHAVETMQALRALTLTGEVRTPEELGLFRVLLNHTGRREVDLAFDRTLAAVRGEQDRCGVPLLETLECFLAEGRRPRPAARALRIHVNTLYQRLTTLDRLLGKQWRDPDRALELHLLLRLRRAIATVESRTVESRG